MSRFRNDLPQLGGGLFLTDSGLETTLVFLDGIELPCFASYGLLADRRGRERLADYYALHARMAAEAGAGFILESPTWRANRDWGARLGHDAAALADFNRDAIGLMEEVRAGVADSGRATVISGNIGPRGDGYVAGEAMTAAEAADYHGEQIATFAATAADLVTAMTMTNVPEAVGVVAAARRVGMPAVISFTVETDGRLPSGAGLGEAIRAVDDATGGHAAYFMVNCAHPTHFDSVLDADADWASRLRGIRANASRCSHAELDAATELDAGNPAELGAQYRTILDRFGHINVLGGCCGTDERHVRAIGRACAGVHRHAA